MMLGVAFFFACDLWGMREGQFVVYMGPSDEVNTLVGHYYGGPSYMRANIVIRNR